MKIAFCNRPDYANPLGGDAIQMLKTKEHLEKIYEDITINIVTDPSKIDSSYDCVHIFNYLTYQITRTFFDKAIELNIPIVSSCIYWDYSYAVTGIFGRIFGYSEFITKKQIEFKRTFLKITSVFMSRPVGISLKFKKNVQFFLDNSKIVLPNSQEEANLLLDFAGRKYLKDKISVVYNGVELDSNSTVICNITEQEFLNKYKLPSDYILQVGRIEYLKNQMNLLSALYNDSNIPIVFVGKPHDLKYFDKLYKLGEKRGNVFFFNYINHDEISLFYKYARLHVSLSLRESPGLVSMEALQNHCPIVIPTSEFLPIDTYFKGNKYIVDPFDKNNIRDTVMQAYNERQLPEFNIKQFSWDSIAKQTYDAYKLI